MCAKCGLMLCEDCSFVVGTRRYCESCLLSDNNLIQDFQYMISRQLQIGKVATVVDYDGPQKWSEVPSALLNMLKDSDIFFRGAYKTPYWITFPVAFLALLPNAFITYVVKLDDIVVRYASEYQATQNADVERVLENLQMLQSMQAENPAVMYAAAVFAPLFQILVLDACLFAALRIFTRKRLSWSQASALVNFSIIPFGLAAFATWFNAPFVYYVALGLMIINISTAVRSATKCTFMQGLGVMLSFVFVVTLAGVVYVFV